MRHHYISWNQYSKIYSNYYHVASFAYWPYKEDRTTAPILAIDEEEFKIKLQDKLHADVVFLGFNFGTNDEFEKNLRDRNFKPMSNQYGGNYGRKRLDETFKGSFVEGAYMTDLFKFILTDSYSEPTGIATKKANEVELSEQIVEKNIFGLQYELYDIVGVKRDPIFILMGKNTQEYQNAISTVFKKSTFFKFPHYQAHLSSNEFQKAADNILHEINTMNW